MVSFPIFGLIHYLQIFTSSSYLQYKANNTLSLPLGRITYFFQRHGVQYAYGLESHSRCADYLVLNRFFLQTRKKAIEQSCGQIAPLLLDLHGTRLAVLRGYSRLGTYDSESQAEAASGLGRVPLRVAC